MLDYKTINEAYSFAEKAAAKKATEPDEMDLAGAPLSGANKEEGGILSKFLKNVGKARKNLSKNVEKSKENLSKNVAKTKEKLGLNEPEGQVNKDLLNKTTSRVLGQYNLGKPNIKENLNLPKPKPKLAPKSPAAPKKGVSMTDLHHKKEGNPYSMTGAHHQGGATPTTVNPDSPKPKPTEEHKEAAKGHLQKLLGQAKDAAEHHPVAAGALGALAAGAGALGVKKLLSRKKKTA